MKKPPRVHIQSRDKKLTECGRLVRGLRVETDPARIKLAEGCYWCRVTYLANHRWGRR